MTDEDAFAKARDELMDAKWPQGGADNDYHSNQTGTH